MPSTRRNNLEICEDNLKNWKKILEINQKCCSDISQDAPEIIKNPAKT